MEYSSRIHIIVKDNSVWKCLTSNKLGIDFSNETDTSWYISGDFSLTEHELISVVDDLATRLDKNGVVISDTTNIDVDTYEFYVCYFGNQIRSESIFHPDKRKRMFHETSIKDVAEWINYSCLVLEDEEDKLLSKCGIWCYKNGNKKQYKNIQKQEFEEITIDLRETWKDNRANIIEHISAFDLLELRIVPDEKVNPWCIEAFFEGNSIGCLPSDVGDELVQHLMSNVNSLYGTVVEVKKLSERNKLAKSPIVKVLIKNK
jgi:hypothetical protein